MDTIGVILVIVVYAVLMGMALEIPPESGDDDYEDWEGKF
jgi:hypothetical protein